MEKRIEIGSKLYDVKGKCKKADVELADLKKRLEKIDVKLSSGKWTGEAHQTAVSLQEIMKQYHEAIHDLVQQARQLCTDLEENADTFDDHSEQVALAKKATNALL